MYSLASLSIYPNGIMASLSARKTDDEAHGDVFPLLFRYRQKLKSSDEFLVFRLYLQAH